MIIKETACWDWTWYVEFMKGPNIWDIYFKGIFEMLHVWLSVVYVWSTLLGCIYLDLMKDGALCSEN